MGIKFIEVKEELDEAEQQPNVNDVKGKPAELVARVFASRNAAHFAHLLTPSYAQHVALQGFYDGIIGLIDSYAETFMGRFGKFESFPNVKESALDGLTIVGNLTNFIDKNYEALGLNEELKNIIQEISSLCSTTAYKLRELK